MFLATGRDPSFCHCSDERLSELSDQDAANPSSMLQSQYACVASLKRSRHSQQSSQLAMTSQPGSQRHATQALMSREPRGNTNISITLIKSSDLSHVEARSLDRTIHPGSQSPLPVPTPSLCLHLGDVSSSRAYRPLTWLYPVYLLWHHWHT